MEYKWHEKDKQYIYIYNNNKKKQNIIYKKRYQIYVLHSQKKIKKGNKKWWLK